MGSSNVCWGIELGSGAIKALKVENDNGDLKVLDFEYLPHARVLSTPELDQNDAMRVALGTLVNKIDIGSDQVAISIPGNQSFARFATLPPVEPKKVPDIVKFEAVQQIPFALEEVEWDYQTFVSPDTPDIEVGIFAVTRQVIMEQLNLLGDVGITPSLATLSPVAAYNALASDLSFTEETPGTIILDVGTVSSDLIIAEAGRVWVRTFPIGGHQFTEALVSAFKISYSKAEKLKRESEQSKHSRHALQAMRPVFSELVNEIKRSIDFYKSVHADADLKRLIGLGSTFRLPGLRKYLKQQLQLDVYRLEQFKKLAMEGSRAGEFQAASLNMGTAYGCALQALDRAPLKANLMPVPVLREAMWKRKVPYLGVAAGMAAAAAGAMFIRPLLDSTAFQGAEKPPIIGQVLSEAQALRQEADQAGVTSSADGTMDAARIVDLVSDRELYANVLVDASNLVGLVRERVESAKSSDPYLAEQIGDRDAMSLVSLETDFKAAGGGFDSFGGSSSRGTRGNRGAPQDTGASSELMQRISSMRRVEVKATFEIPVSQGDAEGYLFDLIEPVMLGSLQDTRDEYSILAEGGGFWAIGDAPASGSSRTIRATGPTRTPTRTPARRPGGSGGSGDPGAVAPLTRPEDEGAMGPSTRVTLTWYAVLDLDPNANNEGEG